MHGAEMSRLGGENSVVLGAYGWDTHNEAGERLLAFVPSNDLTLVITFFSAPQKAPRISSTR